MKEPSAAFLRHREAVNNGHQKKEGEESPKEKGCDHWLKGVERVCRCMTHTQDRRPGLSQRPSLAVHLSTAENPGLSIRLMAYRNPNP